MQERTKEALQKLAILSHDLVEWTRTLKAAESLEAAAHGMKVVFENAKGNPENVDIAALIEFASRAHEALQPRRATIRRGRFQARLRMHMSVLVKEFGEVGGQDIRVGDCILFNDRACVVVEQALPKEVNTGRTFFAVDLYDVFESTSPDSVKLYGAHQHGLYAVANPRPEIFSRGVKGKRMGMYVMAFEALVEAMAASEDEGCGSTFTSELFMSALGLLVLSLLEGGSHYHIDANFLYREVATATQILALVYQDVIQAYALACMTYDSTVERLKAGKIDQQGNLIRVDFATEAPAENETGISAERMVQAHIEAAVDTAATPEAREAAEAFGEKIGELFEDNDSEDLRRSVLDVMRTRNLPVMRDKLGKDLALLDSIAVVLPYRNMLLGSAQRVLGFGTIPGTDPFDIRFCAAEILRAAAFGIDDSVGRKCMEQADLLEKSNSRTDVVLDKVLASVTAMAQ